MSDNVPAQIRLQLTMLDVWYHDFEGHTRSGHIQVHESLAEDVKEWFKLAHRMRFPIQEVSLAEDYGGNDELMMEKNTSSGFNYREISGKSELSQHALGRAFDINPKQNPYIRQHAGRMIVTPEGSVWNPEVEGTLHNNLELVRFLKERGWEWGGDWSLDESGRVDYQHFQKLA